MCNNSKKVDEIIDTKLIGDLDNYLKSTLKNKLKKSKILEKFRPLLPEENNDELKENKKFNQDIKKSKGVYAFFFNGKNDEDIKAIKSFKFEKKQKMLEGYKKTKKRASEIYDNKACRRLFYIGKTCRSFASRVINASGHMKGGNTSVSIKLYKYITNKEVTYDPKEHKDTVAKWMEENITVKFYPVPQNDNSDIIISIIEEALISMYQPALNSVGCKNDEKACECFDH